MTIQPGDPRAGHHQARNTQELLDAADQVGERQERYSRDPSTDEFPVPAGSREPRGETREPASQATAEPMAQQQSMEAQPVAEPQPMEAQPMEAQSTDPRSMKAQPMDSQPGAEPGSMGDPAVDEQAEPVAERAPSAGEHRERTSARDTEDEHVALFDPREADELRGRWREVQTAFVDDPRSAVQGADQLVAQVIQSLTASFAAHKNELDGQWQGTDQSGPATEDLRLALRRYRTLFNQLLNT